MRTTLDIDSRLLDSVVSATGEKSKSGAVNAALKEYMRRKHVQELIDSWGTVIVDDHSPRALELERRVRQAGHTRNRTEVSECEPHWT